MQASNKHPKLQQPNRAWTGCAAPPQNTRLPPSATFWGRSLAIQNKRLKHLGDLFKVSFRTLPAGLSGVVSLDGIRLTLLVWGPQLEEQA